MEFVIGHQDSMGLLDEDIEEVDATRAALSAIVQKGVVHATEVRAFSAQLDAEAELRLRATSYGIAGGTGRPNCLRMLQQLTGTFVRHHQCRGH